MIGINGITLAELAKRYMFHQFESADLYSLSPQNPEIAPNRNSPGWELLPSPLNQSLAADENYMYELR